MVSESFFLKLLVLSANAVIKHARFHCLTSLSRLLSFRPDSRRQEQRRDDRGHSPSDDHSRVNSRRNQSDRDQISSRRERSSSRGRSSRDDRQGVDVRNDRSHATNTDRRHDAPDIVDRRPRNRDEDADNDKIRASSKDLESGVGVGQQQPDSSQLSREASQDQQESRGGHNRSHSGSVSNTFNRRDRATSTVFVRVGACQRTVRAGNPSGRFCKFQTETGLKGFARFKLKWSGHPVKVYDYDGNHTSIKRCQTSTPCEKRFHSRTSG